MPKRSAPAWGVGRCEEIPAGGFGCSDVRKESERQSRQRFVRFFHTFRTDCLLVLSLTLLLARAAAAQSSATADQVLAQARQTYAEQGGREALPGFDRALALYRDTHDRHGEAVVLGHIGNCYESMSDYPRAIGYLRRALAMKHELGDRHEEGKTLSNLGLVYWHTGDYAKAIDHLTRALGIARQVRDRQLEGSAHNNLGFVYDEMGDLHQTEGED